MPPERAALAVAACGLAVSALLAFDAFGWSPGEPSGGQIYNHYALALLEGRFDVPIRAIGGEGHYDPSGRAFVYYGLAPLVTRFLAAPLFDIRSAALPAFTIWLAVAIGCAAYQWAFLRLLGRFGGALAGSVSAAALLSALVWFASPGPLLAANTAVYHEPIAVGFALSGLFFALMVRAAHLGAPAGAILLPAALVAGLAVFARPHVAVGLYAGVVVLALVDLRMNGWAAAGRAVGVALVLAGAGVALLAVNQVRFADPFLMHGSFEPGPLQYGTVFWGFEDTASARARGFTEEGRFNPLRIPANLFLHLAITPWPVMERIYQALSAPVGAGRVEGPFVGAVILWMPWLVIAAAGFRARVRPTGAWSAGALAAALVAAVIPVLLLCSYPTVTLRYRLELFPLLAVVVAMGLTGLGARLGALPASGSGAPFGGRVRVLAVAMVLSGSFNTVQTARAYAIYFVDIPQFVTWSRPFCEDMVRAKGLPNADIDQLCRL